MALDQGFVKGHGPIDPAASSAGALVAAVEVKIPGAVGKQFLHHGDCVGIPTGFGQGKGLFTVNRGGSGT